MPGLQVERPAFSEHHWHFMKTQQRVQASNRPRSLKTRSLKSSLQRRLNAERLEDRRLLAVSFEFNYLAGSATGFNDPVRGNEFRSALESAANRLGDALLHDATVQLDVQSLSFDGAHVAIGTSAPPMANPQGAFAHGVLPAKILGQGDLNAAASDGQLDVFFFDNSDALAFVTSPGQVDQSNEVDFQAVMYRALVHAIGFESATNANGSDDAGNGLNNPGTWRVLDQYLTDSNGNSMIDGNANSSTAFRMDTSASQWPLDSVGGPGPNNGLFFNGPLASQIYGGPVPLYSPAPTGNASSTYLNDQNITVALGASMPADPFTNRTTPDSLASIIDAPSAADSEDHLQSTHVWVSRDDLELDFDFGQDYRITQFHFWNYLSEFYDVDEIDVVFRNSAGQQVGSLVDLEPELGGTNGANPIFAEDFPVSLSGPARFANVMIRGENGQIDFQNIGFTAAADLVSRFDVPHLDSEGFPSNNSIFSPRTHLLSQAVTGGPVPQQLSLLEKAILSDVGIQFREETSPVISVPQAITLEANAPGGLTSSSPAWLNYLSSATATDLFDPNPIITNNAPALVVPLGTSTIEFTATDQSGNEDSGSSMVTIVDTTPPNLRANAASFLVEATGPNGIDAASLPFVITATDLVDESPSLTQVNPQNDYAIGTTTISYRSTDATGNASTIDVSLIVRDSTPPEFDLPAEISLISNVAGGADLQNEALAQILRDAASDVVDPSPTFRSNPLVIPIGTTTVRFTALDSTGNLAVRNASVTVVQDLTRDFGDAPTGYPVLLSDDGARHQLSDLQLGSQVSGEADGQPQSVADGDAGDDGVRSLASIFSAADGPTTSSFLIDVTGPGKLDAFVDFNGDLDWDDSGEQILTSVDVIAGENIVSFQVPPNVATRATAMRVRLSSAGGLSPTGAATDGEVEDHVIQLVSSNPLSPIQIDSPHGDTTVEIATERALVSMADGVLFESPTQGIGSFSVAGNDTNDSITITLPGTLPNLSNGWSFSGGAGENSVAFSGAPEIDLTQPEIVLTQFANVDLRADGATRLTVDAASVQALAPDGVVSLLLGQDDTVRVRQSEQWSMIDPQTDDDGFWMRGQSDNGEIIRLQTDRPWRNFLRPSDVNNDGTVTASDALRAINEIARNAFSDSNTFELVDPQQLTEWPHVYFDHNGDNRVSPIDALRVINELAVLAEGGLGESEQIGLIELNGSNRNPVRTEEAPIPIPTFERPGNSQNDFAQTGNEDRVVTSSDALGLRTPSQSTAASIDQLMESVEFHQELPFGVKLLGMR